MNNGEIIILTLIAVNLICTAILHGTPKDEKSYNFHKAALNAIICLALYWYAGLFGSIFN